MANTDTTAAMLLDELAALDQAERQEVAEELRKVSETFADVPDGRTASYAAPAIMIVPSALIAVAPALAVSLSGAPDSFRAAPGCPPGQVTGMSTGRCAPMLTPGLGGPSEVDLTQFGAGYVPSTPVITPPLNERDMTVCHQRRGDNNDCVANLLYGPREIPGPSSPINSSP